MFAACTSALAASQDCQERTGTCIVVPARGGVILLHHHRSLCGSSAPSSLVCVPQTSSCSLPFILSKVFSCTSSCCCNILCISRQFDTYHDLTWSAAVHCCVVRSDGQGDRVALSSHLLGRVLITRLCHLLRAWVAPVCFPRPPRPGRHFWPNSCLISHLTRVTHLTAFHTSRGHLPAVKECRRKGPSRSPTGASSATPRSGSAA